MTATRRFTPPWSIDEQQESFIVRASLERKESAAEEYAADKYCDHRKSHYAGIGGRRSKPPKLFIQKLLVALVHLNTPYEARVNGEFYFFLLIAMH
jgi:hypothetical protein